jgi:hypothetical protein
MRCGGALNPIGLRFFRASRLYWWKGRKGDSEENRSTFRNEEDFAMGSLRYTHFLTAALSIAMLWAGSTAFADGEVLEFYQMSFDLDGVNTYETDWGTVHLTFTGSDDILYFNLTVNGSWQVQDVPVLTLHGTGLSQTQVFWFDLGNAVGEDVTSIEYAYELTTTPLGGAPTGATPAVVGDDWLRIQNGTRDVAGPTSPAPAQALVGGAAADPVQHRHEDFPNQQCGDNECVPAGVSNSLQFLNREWCLGIPADSIDIERMKKATNWDSAGCWAYHREDPNGHNAWWEDKDNWIRDHGWPITTRKVDAADIAQIADEIDAKQDIEMVVAGHLVCVVGIVDLGGGRYSVTYADDRRQNQDPPPCSETTCTWNGTSWEGEPLAGRGILYFIVECPTVDPSSIESTSWGRVKALFR